MLFNVKNNWNNILNEILESKQYKELEDFIEGEYDKYTVFPCKENIFKALNITDFYDVKAVILGQDPYFNVGEADGLAFSCSKKEKFPPSLKNIFKELQDDLGYLPPNGGSLHSWAKEGVLLLNSVLTVEKDKAFSHKNKGWETFTDSIIKMINEKEKPVVSRRQEIRETMTSSFFTPNREYMV